MDPERRDAIVLGHLVDPTIKHLEGALIKKR
jgi:hypothetical protein